MAPKTVPFEEGAKAEAMAKAEATAKATLAIQTNFKRLRDRHEYEEKFLERIEGKQRYGKLLKEWEFSLVIRIEARLDTPPDKAGRHVKHYGLTEDQRLAKLKRFQDILAKNEEYKKQFPAAVGAGARGFLARRKVDKEFLSKFEAEFASISRVFSEAELRLVNKAINRLTKSTDFEEIRARPVTKPANIASLPVVERAKQDLKRYKDLLEKHYNRHEAAAKIEAAFRGYKERKALVADAAAAKAAADAAAAAATAANPVVDPAAAAEAAARAAAANWPRRIDRNQMLQELKVSPGSMIYNDTNKAFESTTNPLLQGQWVNGIVGKRKAELDANGNPIMRNQAHLGLDKSHAYNSDSIRLAETGFMVAEYDDLIDLQKDIDAVRIKRSSLKSGEIKVAFASYKSKNKKTLAEEENYVMLIETSKGLTSVFVGNEGAVIKKISDAEAAFKGDKDDMLAAALAACTTIPEDKRQEAAEKMVRQAIRESAMKTMAEEIKEGQIQSEALHKFDQGDLEKIYGPENTKLSTLDKGVVKFTGFMAKHSIEVDRIPTNPERLARQINGTFGKIPDPVSNYMDHGGVAISKNRNGAKVTFNYAAIKDGGSKAASSNLHDEMWINIPETSFYIKCRVAFEAAEYPNFENGNYVGMKYRKAGETWIEPNTIYYNNGNGYDPLCVHTQHLKTNPKNTLKTHPMANYQGGAKGFKLIQDAYDKFPVEVVAHVGDVRSVAIKLKGQPIVSTLLDPVAYKNKEEKEVTITKKLLDKDEITAITINKDGKHGNKPWKATEDYFKCPRLDLSVNLKKGLSADEASKINDTKEADEAFKIIEGKIGQVFIKFDAAKFAQENPRAINAGDYHGDKDPYMFASESYKKVERKDIVDALCSGVDAQGATCNVLSPEDAEKYADRYLERFAEVKVKGLKVDNQFTKEEERLLYRASAYNEGENESKTTKMIAEYNACKVALDAKIAAAGSEYTAEEKKEIYKDVLFNIDAVDARGRTALHIAAADNNKELVDALIGAGADPTIRDNKGKTALQLAIKEGCRNAVKPDDNVVSNLEKAEIDFNKDIVRVLTARFEALDIKLNGPYKEDAAGNREKDAKGNPTREHQVPRTGLREELHRAYGNMPSDPSAPITRDEGQINQKKIELNAAVKELEVVQKQLAKAEKRKPSTSPKPTSLSKTAAPVVSTTVIAI